MDPGNDPGRDEYGLPPVDVQIPDDARDLDRDVQAYYRELRARRRHTRARRITGPLTRHGMVMPLIAACLAVALMTGTLLTVLTGRQLSPLPGRALAGPAQRAPSPAARGTSGSGRSAPGSASPGPELLPNPQVTLLSGRRVGLRSLAPAVLAWVPAGCTACGPVLRRLARQTAVARVPIYFVTGRAVQDLQLLARQVGHRRVVEDPANALASGYGLLQVTAIFAHSGGSVGSLDVVRGLYSPAAMQRFEARLRVLASERRGAPGLSGPAEVPTPQVS